MDMRIIKIIVKRYPMKLAMYSGHVAVLDPDDIGINLSTLLSIM